MTRPEFLEKNDWYSEIKLEGIQRRLKEQGDEEEQEINSINHTEEMLVRLNVAIETNEGTEAEIAIEVNETA